MKHVYAEYITLWLKGGDVQFKNNGRWEVVTGLGDFDRLLTEFRVNPRSLTYAYLEIEHGIATVELYSEWITRPTGKLKLTLDVQTSQIISAEVLGNEQTWQLQGVIK